MNTQHVRDEWEERAGEPAAALADALPEEEETPEALSGFEGMSDEDVALLAQQGDVRA